ncbi:hypothetical protein [Isoptericola sp. NPDC056134]
MTTRTAAATVRDVVVYVAGAAFFTVLGAVNGAREQLANYRRWPGL